MYLYGILDRFQEWWNSALYNVLDQTAEVWAVVVPLFVIQKTWFFISQYAPWLLTFLAGLFVVSAVSLLSKLTNIGNFHGLIQHTLNFLGTDYCHSLNSFPKHTLHIFNTFSSGLSTQVKLRQKQWKLTSRELPILLL